MSKLLARNKTTRMPSGSNLENNVENIRNYFTSKSCIDSSEQTVETNEASSAPCMSESKTKHRLKVLRESDTDSDFEPFDTPPTTPAQKVRIKDQTNSNQKVTHQIFVRYQDKVNQEQSHHLTMSQEMDKIDKTSEKTPECATVSASSSCWRDNHATRRNDRTTTKGGPARNHEYCSSPCHV